MAEDKHHLIRQHLLLMMMTVTKAGCKLNMDILTKMSFQLLKVEVACERLFKALAHQETF